MKIKTKLYGSAAIVIVVATILFSVAFVTSVRVIKEDEKHHLAHDVNIAISELDLVTYEYLLHHEERMERQWRLKYDSTLGILEKAVEEGRVESAELILNNYVVLGDLFSQVTENYKQTQGLIDEGAPQERVDAAILLGDRLVAKLLIISHSIITDTSQLSKTSLAKALGAQRLSRIVTLILMAALVIIVTVTSLAIARGITKPLYSLTKGAQIIGKGDLNYRVVVKNNDEFDMLSVAFNQMTMNLKQITASRDELDKEVTGRKLAEEDLRKSHGELEVRVEERTHELKQANERTNHLNLVLRAIRNVNQLLTQERDRDKLLQGVCNNLVENREYNSAWIVLFDERGNLITTAEAGLGDEFMPVREQLEKGERTECGRRVSSQSGVVVINDPLTDCHDCPLAGQYGGRGGMAIRLEHEGRFYGQLTVSTIPAVYENEEERSLFEEVAKDIAFGLYSMEAEKERKKAEDEREEVFKDLDFAHKKLVKSQIRLIRSEKMNAIGTLVAGIAHELNNPMMGILNYVQYCRKHTPSGDKRYGVLEDAESEVKRCVDIVDNLLTFSHMEKEGKEEPVEAACSAILERVFKLITHRVKSERVSVDKRYAADIPDIWIRANRIQQVFLNLLNNALDALKESEKKEIEIEMRREKNYIAVSIADTGPGIAPKDLEHIFEPFFTTKPVGGGTGLGLFVTQNIIEQEGGSVTCESKVGEGTKFTVKLPVNTDEHR